jgi:hypothetical protein
LWDIGDERCLETMSGHSDGVIAVTTSDFSAVVSGSIDKTLAVWSVAGASQASVHLSSEDNSMDMPQRSNATCHHYVGAWSNGKMHGQGIYMFANGFSYQGQFKNGVIDGFGTMTDPTGRKLYEGDYVNGKMHGKGTYTFPDGSYYTGEMKYDLICGYGVMRFASASPQVQEAVQCIDNVMTAGDVNTL